MTKMLNMDQVVDRKPGRELVLGGKTYTVPPMSVENFIPASQEAEQFANAAISVQIEKSIGLIALLVPDIDVAAIRRLPLENLRVFLEFVRGDDVAEMIETKVGEGADVQLPAAAVDAGKG